MYVITKKSDGQYVARRGEPRSFTRRLDLAELYNTEQDARSDLREGERVHAARDLARLKGW